MKLGFTAVYKMKSGDLKLTTDRAPLMAINQGE